jgi:site-specific DNA-methyltransferase (adenine-specific)
VPWKQDSGVGRVVLADNLDVLPTLPSNSVDLIYVDPPFNTGKVQRRKRIRATRDAQGDRVGFQGRRYHSEEIASGSFRDRFDDFLHFLEPRLIEARRILSPYGCFFLHIDYREVHYCKVLLDEVFGRECFMNEIIWAYDFGGRTKKRWPPKHDSILWYVSDPDAYTFNYDQVERIPYLAPGLVGDEKAARGKTPTDVWWHTIVPTNSKEKTRYPTQKPLGVLNRLIKVHTNPGDLVLDFFAGSGTLGEAAARHGRDFILIDSNPEAFEVMRERLAFAEPAFESQPQGPAARRRRT